MIPEGRFNKDVINCRLYLINNRLQILLGHEIVYLIIKLICIEKTSDIL